MPFSPLVTVIVPGRDIADLLPAALNSLIAQTFQDWRAILVDDGSRDATGAIMSQYASHDPRFVLITNDEARGLGAARNQALAIVDTTYTAFLDGDDVMAPNALELAIAALETSGSDIVVGAYRRLKWDGERWFTGDVQPWVSASTSPARSGVSLDEHPDVVGNIVAWSKVTRTSLWQRAGVRFPEGVLYEDQIVAQQLYVAAHGIDTLPDVFVDWRIRATGDSITQREADPAVLDECLVQMRAGLDVLLAAAPAAAAARTTQILRMDVPRLAALAREEGSSRALLAAFARTLIVTEDDLARRTQSVTHPNDPEAPLVTDVYAEVVGW